MGKKINIELAKNIKLEGDDNNIYSLNDFKAQKLILYFYTIDEAPGCAIICQDFSSMYERFKEYNTVVIACSTSHVGSKQNFKKEYNFKQLFLSDIKLELSKALNVYEEKVNEDGTKKTYIVPSTFIFEESGKLLFSRYDINYQDEALTCFNIIKEQSKKETN
ncbi:redoxin domain-containing protein [symbiont of Argiope bruennichi]|uniref:redoxin domain-containing protein n=1 Tax=symbiont of Argiope bruennichi TaxID=2810479 RepID=UPI003DA351F6